MDNRINPIFSLSVAHGEHNIHCFAALEGKLGCVFTKLLWLHVVHLIAKSAKQISNLSEHLLCTQLSSAKAGARAKTRLCSVVRGFDLHGRDESG